MAELDVQLQNIHNKLQQLLKKHLQLQKENEQLKNELNKQQQLLAEKNQQLSELQEKADILKLGVSGLNDQDKKDLERRIDSYLREIEKCLSLLNT